MFFGQCVPRGCRQSVSSVWLLVWKRSLAWMGLSRPGVVWVCFWVPGPPPHGGFIVVRFDAHAE